MKRRMVLASSALSALGLAGCLGGSGDDTTTERTTTRSTRTTTVTTTVDETTAEPTTTEPTTEERTTEPTEEPASDTVEFLHPWSGGDGAAGMAAFLDAFRDANPDVALDATAPQYFQTRLTARLRNDNPPDAWATWAGAALEQYAASIDELEPAPSSSFDAMPERVAASGRLDDRVGAMPFALHRVNCLFFERDVLAAAGVDPATLTDVPGLLDACERVASETSATPFAHSELGPWTTAQLFESTLAATVGESGYREYVAGALATERLRSVVAALDELLAYGPPDAASTAFPEMVGRLANGDAAFMQQGTWTMAFPDVLASDTVEYRAFPGTSGVIDFQTDAIVLGDGPDRPEAARALVEFGGTADGQRSFAEPANRLPTRTDVDPASVSDAVRPAYVDYRDASTYVPSITHGVALAPDPRSKFISAIQSFVEDRDVDATVRELQAIVS